MTIGLYFNTLHYYYAIIERAPSHKYIVGRDYNPSGWSESKYVWITDMNGRRHKKPISVMRIWKLV